MATVPPNYGYYQPQQQHPYIYPQNYHAASFSSPFDDTTNNSNLTSSYISPSHPQEYDPPPPSSPPVTSTLDTVDALNLRVLQRHVPATYSLVFRAPYAVVYTFSPEAESWEKVGKEGSLFVVALHDEGAFATDLDVQESGQRERYAVIILNRRGMDNFVLELSPSQSLQHGEDATSETDDDVVASGVQLEGEYIILQGIALPSSATTTTSAAPAEKVEEVFGLWVFEESDGSSAGTREQCARVLRLCKRQAQSPIATQSHSMPNGREQAINQTSTHVQAPPTPSNLETGPTSPDLMALLSGGGIAQPRQNYLPPSTLSDIGTNGWTSNQGAGSGWTQGQGQRQRGQGQAHNILGHLFQNAVPTPPRGA